MLRLFLSDAVGVGQRAELLGTIRSEHERVLGELLSIRPRAERDGVERGLDMPLMTLDFGIVYQRFIVDWCSELERRLGAAASAAAGATG